MEMEKNSEVFIASPMVFMSAVFVILILSGPRNGYTQDASKILRLYEEAVPEI